jgi:hypothetical protein
VSVNVVVAVSPEAPVAVTTYSATNVGAIWKDVVNVPSFAAVTPPEYVHPLPS